MAGKRPANQRRRFKVKSNQIVSIPRRVRVHGIHTFKRTLFETSVFSIGAAAVYGVRTFNLNQLPSASEFTVLFDQYRIDKIKVVFMPRGDSAEAGTNNNNTKLFTVLDYDDDTAVASIDALCQYENVKCSSVLKDHTRVLVPKFANAVYQSAVATAYGPSTGWLDCNNSTVPHYGIKYGVSAVAGANIVDIKTTYYLSFKNTR